MENEIDRNTSQLREQPPPFSTDSSENRTMALFVGEKYQTYYQEKFDLITTKQPMSGFNIGALLFGVMWLFYRKMYAYGFIAIALMIVIGIVEEMLGITGPGSSIGIAVAFGLFGNTLYKHFVQKKIANLNAEVEIKQAGGTNIWAALGVFIVAVVLIWFSFDVQ